MELSSCDNMPNYAFLGPKLVSNSMEISTKDAMQEDPILAVYFAANWSIGCKNFTPHLVDLYQKWNAKGKLIEIILLSNDRNQEEFDKNFAGMPWLAVPFKDRTQLSKTKDLYYIKGIPTLLIVWKNGRPLCHEGIQEIDIYGENALESFQELYEKEENTL